MDIDRKGITGNISIKNNNEIVENLTGKGESLLSNIALEALTIIAAICVNSEEDCNYSFGTGIGLPTTIQKNWSQLIYA